VAGSRRRVGGRLLALLIALLVAVGGSAGESVAATGTWPGGNRDSGVTLTLFHGDGCPHCAAEIAYLVDELAPAHPEVTMRAYEVWANEANRALMVDAASEYGFEAGSVPVTIVEGPAGHQVLVGFGAGTPAQIEAAIAAVRAPASATPQTDATTPSGAGSVIEVPLVGDVDLSGSSLLVSTLLIGFVDGINPCSLWVLSMLLAIVLHSGSRGRVALVGGVFLTVTAAMYAVYIAGVYSVLTVLDAMTWIQVIVAAVAGTLGVLQLKDGLRPGTGPSLSISAQRRPGLFARMRSLAGDERGVPAVIAGTVALAVGVSLLETPCTAGLPLLWANLLADQGVGTGTSVALFGVYMAVFLLDELVVFAAAVVTLRSTKLQAHHGQALKIVSGSVLVTLAVAMLAVPQAMQTLPGTLAVFAAAAALGTLLWWGGLWWGRPRSSGHRPHATTPHGA
jgi:cytochrome c biogenesis protein CcdA